MDIFAGFKKKTEDGRDDVALAAELEGSERRREFFLLAARALIQCVREFTLDIEELDSRAFKAGLGELTDRLVSEEKLSRIESLFDGKKRGIGEFAARQKDYLKAREAEFKSIIELLTKAMVGMDAESREFNRSILDHGKRIEEITLLDDIKRLKQALAQEVELMRTEVRRKESQDDERIEFLSRQVKALNTELESVRGESERDGLTGIYNRRSFDRYLADLLEKNTLNERPFAVLMLDIDDFKRINDTCGHLTGDSVLLAVANKCRQSIRGEDYLARFGGEEFAVVLPGASTRNAIKKAKQICRAIAETRYVIEAGEARRSLGLTVSIGVSGFRRADTAATLLERADKALYLAKSSGKNRVESEKDIN